MMVCYKRSSDPLNHTVGNTLVTNEWRLTPVDQPEESLIGEMYDGQVTQSYDMVLTNTHDPLFAGTGFHDGSVVPGIVGYEYDHAFDGPWRPKGLVILSHAAVNVFGQHGDANMTYYVAPSGAFVFAAQSNSHGPSIHSTITGC